MPRCNGIDIYKQKYAVIFKYFKAWNFTKNIFVKYAVVVLPIMSTHKFSFIFYRESDYQITVVALMVQLH